MFAWLTIAILGALALGALAMFHYLKSRGETAEARIWAMYDEPMFFKQTMLGFEKYAIEQYEEALRLLDKHGNKFLDRKKDVYLWVHKATVGNEKLDFKKWSDQCALDEVRIREEYAAEKARNALAKNQTLLNAKRLASEEVLQSENGDFERNQNGNYE